jgi:divalent metal cation (Fe/Co/Zn/Cd) transporter
VIVAAGFVALLNSAWPDILVAAAIAALFLHSAATIVREARAELSGHAVA